MKKLIQKIKALFSKKHCSCNCQNNKPVNTPIDTSINRFVIDNGIVKYNTINFKGDEFNDVVSIEDYVLYCQYSNEASLKNPTPITGTINFPKLVKVGKHSLNKAFYGQDITGHINFAMLEDVAANSFDYCFANTKIKSFTCEELQKTFSNTFRYALSGCWELTEVNFPKLVKTDISSFDCAFSACLKLRDVNFPVLEEVKGTGSFMAAFNQCKELEDITFPKLKTITGDMAFSRTFSACKKLQKVNFPILKTANTKSCFANAFNSCETLKTISFPKLSEIKGSCVLSGAFSGCELIEHVYFPALTTKSFGEYKDQFKGLFQNLTNKVVHTIHFPANLEHIIKDMDDYPLFGVKEKYKDFVKCEFDLPVTE